MRKISESDIQRVICLGNNATLHKTIEMTKAIDALSNEDNCTDKTRVNTETISDQQHFSEVQSFSGAQSFSGTQREWLASLDLTIDNDKGRSRLKQNRHKGPLRVLRPYYPEGSQRIHLYVLHPPGGLVCGDQLRIDIDLKDSTQTLLTTPSAGKIYGTDTQKHSQRQLIHLRCGKDAELEWLPQENIIFDGANGYQELTLDTRSSSRFILWEITALGRPDTGAPFKCGSFTQKLRVDCEGEPLFIERIRLTGNDTIHSSPWGLNKSPVYGSMLLGYFKDEDCQRTLDDLRTQLTLAMNNAGIMNCSEYKPPSDHSKVIHWSATRKDNMLIVRALAFQSEPVKRLFHQTWDYCRQALMNRASHHPRIWST